MDLFEIAETQHLRREEAAARLHALADALASNNSVEFERDGRRITVEPALIRHSVRIYSRSRSATRA